MCNLFHPRGALDIFFAILIKDTHSDPITILQQGNSKFEFSEGSEKMRCQYLSISVSQFPIFHPMGLVLVKETILPLLSTSSAAFYSLPDRFINL